MNLVEFGMRGTGMHSELGSIASIRNRPAGEWHRQRRSVLTDPVIWDRHLPLEHDEHWCASKRVGGPSSSLPDWRVRPWR